MCLFGKNEHIICIRRLRYIVWEESIVASQCAAVLNNPEEIDEPLLSQLQSRSVSAGILREQRATLLCAELYSFAGMSPA
jgi:hypothetical protein